MNNHEPRPELSSANEFLESTHGKFSDELYTLVDGEYEHVVIYHKVYDDRWSDYTAVLDDGTVLSHYRSPRRMILGEDLADA